MRRRVRRPEKQVHRGAAAVGGRPHMIEGNKRFLLKTPSAPTMEFLFRTLHTQTRTKKQHTETKIYTLFALKQEYKTYSIKCIIQLIYICKKKKTIRNRCTRIFSTACTRVFTQPGKEFVCYMRYDMTDGTLT